MDIIEPISSNTLSSIAEDYYALREEGIRLLQQLSGNKWTDYNTHDPGITILEQLCYALTDLAYRIGHPIPDILAAPNDEPYAPELYRARDIMSSSPITLDDYRKLLLNIDGIRNAWIEVVGLPEPLLIDNGTEIILAKIKQDKLIEKIPVLKNENEENKNLQTAAPVKIPLKGLLQVKVEPDMSVAKEILLSHIIDTVMAKRNLGEDFVHFEVLEPEYIQIVAEIEVDEVLSPASLLKDIYIHLQQVISPEPNFYSLKQMMDKGYSVDDLMEGPPLAKGYLDPKEFQHHTKREFLRGSDLINVLTEIPGVRFVKRLEIRILDDQGQISSSDFWSVTLNRIRFPQLLIPGDEINLPNQNKSRIELQREGFVLQFEEKDFLAKWQMYKQDNSVVKKNDLDLQSAPGRYRFLGTYQSIQNHFPILYGIGEAGVNEQSPIEVKARVNQLKAYLLFFDQILCNSFAQLEGFRTMISLENPTNQNFFTKIPEDPAGILYSNDTQANSDFENYPINGRLFYRPALLETNQIMSAEEEDRQKLAALKKRLPTFNKSMDDSTENKQLHRIADHLLARVGEQISDYHLLGKTNSQENHFLDLKKNFLKQYQVLSHSRSIALNYANQSDKQVIELSKLQQRIAILLDIPLINSLPLSDASQERFWLVEHQLLRPLMADFEQYNRKAIPNNTFFNEESKAIPDEDSIKYYVQKSKDSLDLITSKTKSDIFSLQLSFIFPDGSTNSNTSNRFSNFDFRKFAERIIRRETPAHIKTRVYWMNISTLNKFELALKDWHNALQKYHQPFFEQLALSNMKTLLQTRIARNKLIDCISDVDESVGYTYPILDLPLRGPEGLFDSQHPLRVQEGNSATIFIDYSQEGVRYQLCNRQSENENVMAVMGNGGTISLSSEIMRTDDNTKAEVRIDLEVSAEKIINNVIITNKTWLQKIVPVAIKQLVWNLEVELYQNGNKIENGVIDYNLDFIIRIQKPQENVLYTIYNCPLQDNDFVFDQDLKYSINQDRFNKDKSLFHVQKELNGMSFQQLTTASMISQSETPTNENESNSFSNNQAPYLDIKIEGSGKYIHLDSMLKVGASFSEDNTETEFLDASILIFLKPNPNVQISKLNEQKDVLQIISPEPGVLYTLLFPQRTPYASSAWIPEKGLAADFNKDANEHIRTQVNFVVNALTNKEVPSLILPLPEIEEKTSFTVLAQKLNTKLEADLTTKLSFEINSIKTDLDIHLSEGAVISQQVNVDGNIEVPFKSSVTIRIIDAQQGVKYSINSASLSDDDFEDVNDEINNLKYRVKADRLTNEFERDFKQTTWSAIPETGKNYVDINIPENKITKDSIIRVRAEFSGEKPIEDFLNKLICIFVKPDTEIAVSQAETNRMKLQIDSPEPGVIYSLVLSDSSIFSSCAWLPEKDIDLLDRVSIKNMLAGIDKNSIRTAKTKAAIYLSLPTITSETSFTISALKVNTNLLVDVSTKAIAKLNTVLTGLNLSIASGNSYPTNANIQHQIEHAFNAPVTLRIFETQADILYTVYTSTILDSDFEYQQLADGKLSYQIKESSLSKADQRVLNKQIWSAKQKEGENFTDIIVPANNLSKDTILKISASNQDANIKEEFLDRPLCVFVGPDPNVKATKVSNNKTRVRINTPEIGVLYSLLLPDGKVFSSVTYLPNKGLAANASIDENTQIRTEVDFVLNAMNELPLILPLPVIESTITFTIKAQKLNTKIEVILHEMTYTIE